MRSVKHELERQRASLARAITAGTGANRASDAFREFAKDPYGNASAIHDEEIATELVQRRAREFQEVSRALEDIEAGRYGVCSECGGAIGEARLRVVPFATRCVRCQARRETPRRAG
jgi:DnaK suppressor protein